MTKQYKLASGITAIDLPQGPILIGQHEVPLIPQSHIMLLSDTQLRSAGIDICGIAKRFGGRSGIFLDDDTIIPLHLERGLMTCPIRMPTHKELNTLHVYWLTDDAPWDPSSATDPLDDPSLVPYGYPTHSGELHLLSLHIDPMDLGELTPTTESSLLKLHRAYRWIHLQHHPTPFINHYAQMVKLSDADFTSYRPHFGWKPLETIKKTFEATTQYGGLGSDAVAPLKRHYKSRFPALNRSRLQEMFCTDTYFGSKTALGGYTCAQIYYGTKSKLVVVYPMISESQGPQTLEDFCRNQGAPIKIKNDRAKMETGKGWTQICRTFNIEQCTTEAHHPWQNEAERQIQEVKRMVNTIMDRTGAPTNLWMLCTLYSVYILNRIARESLNWRSAFETCYGITPDISAILLYRFYQRIYYLDAETPFPDSKERPGRFVGIAENIGDAMTFWILTSDSHQLIARSVIRSAEIPESENRRVSFIDGLDDGHTARSPAILDIRDFQPNGNLPIIDPHDLLGKIFKVNHEGSILKAEVKELNDDNTYLIEYADGKETNFTYAELTDLLNKENEDGNEYWTYSEILDHRKNTKKNGKQVMEVLVKWDTGEPTWEPLNVIKTDDPVTVAAYVKKKNLEDNPYWKWAKKYTKSPHRFIRYTTQMAMAKKRAGPKYKFGIKVPRTIKEALTLDKENGDTLWKQALDKEMNKIRDFKVFSEAKNGKPPPDYKRITCHVIFDAKHDGRRKARFVAGGHLTSDPGEDSYSGVIAPDAIRLGMFAAVHNNLKVLTADIGNAYLYANTKEKVYTVLGPEYGNLGNKTLLFVKSLYGLKTSGARFHEHLSDTLKKLAFKPSKADADLWIKDCGTHYEYIARYVDDILVFSKNPQKILTDMSKIYTLQAIGVPEYYLGGDFKVHRQPTGISTFTFCAKTYIKNICQKIEELMGKELKKYDSPMATNDHPELEDTQLLNPDNHSRYRMLIGCAQWAITLGRLDIMFAVQTMARFSASPQQAHMDRMLRLFGYLKYHPELGILIDPSPIKLPMLQDIKVNWEEQYPCSGEELPPSMPTPKGNPVQLTVYVDADHAHDRLTRRSVTGYIIFINNTPVKWYSKRQNTVETSTYGAELVALRIAVEGIIEFRYKLRMMGIYMEGPSQVLCDNKSVVLNTTLPSSTLKKKHNAIAYHRVRETVAAKVIKVNHIDGKTNLADILTKATDGPTFIRHVSNCLHAL